MTETTWEMMTTPAPVGVDNIETVAQLEPPFGAVFAFTTILVLIGQNVGWLTRLLCNMYSHKSFPITSCPFLFG